MILSERILKKAPNEVQNFFANEFNQLQNAPKDVLLWIREYVNLTEEEEKQIDSLLCLENNVKNVFNCFSIINSIYIFNSNEIKDSKWIMQSNKVESSERIRNSFMVTNSNDVHSGKFVVDSKQVYLSNNVTKGSNIVRSNFIINSNNILESKNISDSERAVRCDTCKNIYFSSDCKNLKNSLFCFNIDNNDYLVFNKKVEPEIFELILQQYLQMISGNVQYINWNEETIFKYGNSIPVSFVPSVYYPNLNDYFYEWMTTLPGFDKEIAYFLTFKKEFK